MPRKGRFVRSLVRLLIAGGLVAIALHNVTATESSLPVRALQNAVITDLPMPNTVPYLGIATVPDGGGLRVQRVVAHSPADVAGLTFGDLVTSVDGRAVRAPSDLDAALAARRPGDRVRLDVRRGRGMLDRSVRLGTAPRPDSVHRKGTYRLAVVPLLFHGGRTTASLSSQALDRFYFARTGKQGSGASLADYFNVQSSGRLVVSGSVFAAVSLSGTRESYSADPMGGRTGSMFEEAVRLLSARDGAASLAQFDGVAFLYAGAQETRPGRALWPHRAVVSLGARRMPYTSHSIETVANGVLGEHCHEFGHLLGLHDSYGVGHLTGSGDFCIMSIGHRGGASDGAKSPFSLCAWCKMRLSWVDVTVVDPRLPQRVRIPAEQPVIAAVPLTAKSDEFLLLEVRKRAGFDRELPAEGLLVWHVVVDGHAGAYGTTIDLIEAHGIRTYDASLVRADEIAFPTPRARDLTPRTQPTVKPRRAGAFPLHLTEIVRDSLGRVTLTVGIDRPVRQRAPRPYTGVRPGADGMIVRTDPITGETVRFDAHSGSPAPASAPLGSLRR